MPLTLELYGSDTSQKGHLIIDRNNLIITYYVDSSLSSMLHADNNRRRIGNIIGSPISDLGLTSTEKSFAQTEDPRHDALEHMCGYDRRECYHFHIILNTDINFRIMKSVFSNLDISKCTDLISQDCLNYILTTSSQYFLELESSEGAQQTEANYRDDKKKEYKKAEEQMERLNFDKAGKGKDVKIENKNEIKNAVFFDDSLFSLGKKPIKNQFFTEKKSINPEKLLINLFVTAILSRKLESNPEFSELIINELFNSHSPDSPDDELYNESRPRFW